MTVSPPLSSGVTKILAVLSHGGPFVISVTPNLITPETPREHRGQTQRHHTSTMHRGLGDHTYESILPASQHFSRPAPPLARLGMWVEVQTVITPLRLHQLSIHLNLFTIHSISAY